MRAPSKTQKQAIIHCNGPALICAGPGSGKTFTIIQRILYLIEQYHVPPDKILVITYTKAAANEMKERYDAFGKKQGVYFGTFHSVCFNILRQSGKASATSLIAESDKRKLFQVLLGNHGLIEKSGYNSITALLNLVSRMKNLPQKYLEDETAKSRLEKSCDDTDFSLQEILTLWKEYDSYLREQGMLDFDDMVAECLKLLAENQRVLNKYQQMFEYILADEFQDVNQIQYQILKLLAAPADHLFVVGDDDQAIYGFRGATPGIMKQFTKDYPGAKQIMLTENYRSGEGIVKLAEQMIARNKERFTKRFYPVNSGGTVAFSCFDTRKEEEIQLIKELSSLDAEELCHSALILRTNREVVQYTELVREAGIAVKGKTVSKEDIFHGFIMEDIEAFLSYIYYGNKRCDLIRFMNKPNRFFTRAALPFDKVLPEHMERYYMKNPEMLSKIKCFFGQISIAEKLRPALAISFFRKTLGYDDHLRRQTKDSRELQRLLKQADHIQQCFEGYKIGLSLSDFIKSQAEKINTGDPEMIDQQGIRILTMHSAKGLEFDRVYLPDVNEGVIPGREIQTEEAHEEERRLLYVAITRAKTHLSIYYTKERNRKLSRYLEGLIPPP